MSRLIYSANGNILNKSHIIENMASDGSVAQLAKDAPIATTVAQAIQAAQSAPAAQVIQTNQPDYLNLVGNMKIKGAMIATNFYKEDGKTLTLLDQVDVIKLGLPPNVYYVNKSIQKSVHFDTSPRPYKEPLKGGPRPSGLLALAAPSPLWHPPAAAPWSAHGPKVSQ